MLRRFRERIRRVGVRRAVKEAFRAFLPDQFEIWHLELSSSAIAGVTDTGVNLFAGSRAVEKLRDCRAESSNLPIEFYRDEIDNIQSCFLACIGTHPAAIAWPYDHTRPVYFLRMFPEDAEIRHVHSLAQFRGRGLAKAVIGLACGSLFRDGVRNAYAVIRVRNEPSREAFRSCGFVKIAEVRRSPLFGPRFITARACTETWRETLGGIFRPR